MGDWENAIPNKQIIDKQYKHPSNSCVQHQIFLHLLAVPKTLLEIASKALVSSSIFLQIRYIQNAN